MGKPIRFLLINSYQGPSISDIFVILGKKDTISYLKLVSDIFDQSIVMSKDLFGNMDEIKESIKIGSIHELNPVKLNENKDSTLKNTYTIINKI